MKDAIFVYKKGNQFKVLSLDESDHGKALAEEGWKHIETLSASVWLQNLLNMSRNHRLAAIGAIINRDICKETRVSAVASNDGVSCEHLLGVFDTGLGSDAILVYKDVNEEDLACSAAFAPFNFCAICGEKLSN